MDLLNLSKLTDHELLIQTQSEVEHERKQTTKVLHYLREVEIRRLYAARGFTSMFAFCVEALKYSSGAAHRRIEAMRLIVQVPEVEQMVKDGSMNLTTASMVAGFLKAERQEAKKVYTKEEKLELVKKVEGRSKLETEKVLISISPENRQVLPKEKERLLTESLTEIRMIATSELMRKMKRFKELTSHKNPNAGYAELFEQTLDIAIKEIEDEKKPRAAAKFSTAVKSNTAANPKAPAALVCRKTHQATEKQMSVSISRQQITAEQKITRAQTVSSPANQKTVASKRSGFSENRFKSGNPRYIPVELKRQTWTRDNGQCTYEDPITKRRCGSRHFIEFDHAVPVALGGKSTSMNLRLLCRSHNLFMAMKKIGPHIKSGNLNANR